MVACAVRRYRPRRVMRVERRCGPWVAAAAVVAVALSVAVPAGATEPQTRYSLANGCFALQAASGQAIAGADHLRMQATTLGQYLLYRPDRTFLAAQDDGAVTPAQAPSPAADWRVEEAGGGAFRLTPLSATARVLTAGQSG